MSSRQTCFKRVIAGIIVVAMVVTGIHIPETITKAADPVEKPVFTNLHTNLFDGFTEDRVVMVSNSNRTANASVTTKFFSTGTDENGKVTTNIDLTSDSGRSLSDEEFVFWTSKQKYDYAYRNGEPASLYNGTNIAYNGKYLTDLDAEDTFVYETDFQVKEIEGTSRIYFTFRTPEHADTTNANLWTTKYCGVEIQQNAVQLRMDQNNIVKTVQTYKAGEHIGETQHLTILSTPETVSVWIGDTLIFDQVTFNLNDATDNGNGTYSKGNILAKSKRMLPVVAMFVQNSNVTISNQMLYKEDVNGMAEGSMTATQKNYFDSDEITTSSLTDVSTSKNAITCTGPQTAWSTGYINQDLSTDFAASDKVITELTFTPSGLSGDNGSRPGELYVRFRTDGTNYAEIMLRSSALNWLHIKDDNHKADITIDGKSSIVEGKKVHLKVVSDEEKASVYINGICAVRDLVYTDVHEDCGEMAPAFRLRAGNATFRFEDIKIYKENGVLDNVTAATAENNLLLNDSADLTSYLLSRDLTQANTTIEQNGFYTDLRYTTIQGSNIGYYTEENFYFFGYQNSKYKPDSTDSFVVSTYCRASNAALNDGSASYPSRIVMRIAKCVEQDAYYFISGQTLFVFHGNTQVESHNLGSLIGYEVGDWIRLTTVVSPSGYDVYIDGLLICSYMYPDATAVDYAALRMGATGAEVRFLDTSMHINENVDVYKAEIQKMVRSYEVLEGVYWANKAETDEIVAAAKTACGTDISYADIKTHFAAMRGVWSIIDEAKAVNNMVYDGTATIGKSATVSAGTTYKGIELLGDGCYLKNGETWVFAADVTCLESESGSYTRRLGFGLYQYQTDNSDVMIQNSTFYYKIQSNWQQLTANKDSTQWQQGANWHVEYVVKPYEEMKTTITDIDTGTELGTWTVAWENLYLLQGVDETTLCKPYFMFQDVDVEITNIYIGYDLTVERQNLATKYEEYKEKDTTGATTASVQKLQEALDVADNMIQCPEAYGRQEILDVIATMEGALVTADGSVSVGYQEIAIVEVMLQDGETLPTGYLEDKYIISWTEQGSATAATSYDKSKSYEAEYVDLDMLRVGSQTKDGNASYKRLIGSVNSLDKYSAVGFEISKDATTWRSCGDMQKVYDSILANGASKNAENLYGTEYSTHLFVQPLNFGSYTQIYVRAYVKLADGNITVYGPQTVVTVE